TIGHIADDRLDPVVTELFAATRRAGHGGNPLSPRSPLLGHPKSQITAADDKLGWLHSHSSNRKLTTKHTNELMRVASASRALSPPDFGISRRAQAPGSTDTNPGLAPAG